MDAKKCREEGAIRSGKKEREKMPTQFFSAHPLMNICLNDDDECTCSLLSFGSTEVGNYRAFEQTTKKKLSQLLTVYKDCPSNATY